MIDRIDVRRSPMLYISTRTSERASSIAATIKASLAQVRQLLTDSGIAPDGGALAIFTDWNGRVVTVEAGIPSAWPRFRLQPAGYRRGGLPRVLLRGR